MWHTGFPTSTQAVSRVGDNQGMVGMIGPEEQEYCEDSGGAQRISYLVEMLGESCFNIPARPQILLSELQ